MRVWLVDDRPGDDPDGLECLLNQLAARSETNLSLLVVRPGWSDFMTELHQRPPEVLLVRDAPWLDGPWTVDVLNHGPALLVAGEVAGASASELWRTNIRSLSSRADPRRKRCGWP